jgi:hypothetical protein
VIFFMSPVYGATPHGASPVSGYVVPVKSTADADADAAGSLAGALAGALLGVAPLHAAARIAALPNSAANRDSLDARVMR